MGASLGRHNQLSDLKEMEDMNGSFNGGFGTTNFMDGGHEEFSPD